MARPASIALAGYFPTPNHLLPRIAAILDASSGNDEVVTYMDPCAGAGEAIKEIANVYRASIYACEMEATRHKQARDLLGWGSNILHGDAFRVSFQADGKDGISVLFLNPPYDTDPVHGRLEQRFLERFTSALKDDGLLLFLVPYYALKASAELLAKEYVDLKCFKFPEGDFEIFKQVVLVARKSTSLFEPDPAIVAQVMAWNQDVSSCPDLPQVGDAPQYKVSVSKNYSGGLREWLIRPVDMKALAGKIKPWHQTMRGGALVPVPGIIPDLPVQDLLLRTYPVATPLRPAHIAAGIASGLFNGARIEPTDSSTSLPPLLVKGVFDREYKTIEEKRNKAGEVKSVVQVQQPKLVTTVLDLNSHQYHVLRSGSDESRKPEVSSMGVADLLKYYGQSLMDVMERQCPIMYDPRKDSDSIELAPSNRKLFTAQAHATRAIVKLLGGTQASKASRKGKSALLLGEIGSGKCLGLGTLVIKHDGTIVPVEQVQKDDLLMGPDSTPRRVLGTTRGVGPLYKVTPVTGEPWVCNDVHILTLIHTMSDDVFDIPVQEYVFNRRIRRKLSKGGRNTHPREEFKQFTPEDGIDFPYTPEPSLSPYFVGLWYGDGTKGETTCGLAGVSVTTSDSEIVSYLENFADSYGLQVRVNGSGGTRCPSYNLTRGNNQKKPNLVLDQLRDLYGDGRYLPASILYGSRQVRKAFLAGFFDSDGYLGNGVYDFIQKRRAWVDGVCFIARSLGFRATMSPEYKSAYRDSVGEVYWRVCLSGDFSSLPVLLPRKKASPRVKIRRNRRDSAISGYRRTKHATRTGIKVEPLGEGYYAGFELDGDGRFLLGDFTVTHNTSCALVASKTIQSKRPLVMCPPHLLQSWVNEAAVVVPEAEVRILQSITDVASVAADKSDRTIISILSRETGKLGHGWDGVGDTCPKCGSETPKVDLAKKRARCTEKTLVPGNLLAQQCMTYARKISKYNPNAAVVAQLLRGRHERLRVAHYAKLQALGEGAKFQGFQKGDLDYIIDAALSDTEHPEDAQQALVLALVLAGTDDQIEAVSRKFLGADNYSHSDFGRNLLLLLEPGSERQSALIDEFSGKNLTYWNPWKPFKDSIATANESGVFKIAKLEVSWVGGTLTVEKHERDSIALSTRLVHPMVKLAKFRFTAECGEFLYQAIPEPRRVALASHIAKRYPKTFDILIADECFVAGTKVSGVGIETIKVGDVVDSYSEVTHSVCKRRVVKLWRKTPMSLVRVTLNGGKTLICTPNHPFYTEKGWVPAGYLYNTFVHGLDYGSDLGWKLCGVLETHSMGDVGNSTQSTTCEGEGLRLLQSRVYFSGAPTERQRNQSKKPKTEDNSHLLVCLLQQGKQGYSPAHNTCESKGLWLLQSSLFQTRAEEKSLTLEQDCIPVRRAETANLEEDDREEPHATTRDSCQNVSFFERSNFSVARGERPINEASNQTCNSFRLGDGSGYIDRSCVQPIPVLTASLQGGHWVPTFETSGGSGRGYPQNSKMEILGQEKGRGTSRIRVDSVEILEPGSDGKFGGLCPDGFVYNLEVEGTHTYFAEGVLAHNCHEYSSDASAQGISAHRLVSLGIPTIMQTGTVMNGYAESLFMNMWSLSRNFRAEFNREDKQRFIDRYGYRKRMLEERDTQTGEVVEFGSMSDRVTRSERVVGNAPGILPLFLLRHLLTVSVTLHKSDLAIDLPPCKQELHYVEPSADQMRKYEQLQKSLVAAIKKDRFDPERAGKLFGQLAELPSYLDRATSDTGNTERGAFEVRYPESVGGNLVSWAEPLVESEILPKEAWMLDTIVREMSQGRNVMVFSWHTNLLPRYARIISERIGEPVAILHASKVPTAKRQAWIDKELVNKKRHILVTNPVAIQTGLNNLVHFASEIWMENPGCNGTIYRQAIGRVDRIGQKLETRIFSPVYANTLQVQLYDLLLKKVAVSVSTDGLDPESALLAAGVGEDEFFAGLSIGKQLWAMLNDGVEG